MNPLTPPGLTDIYDSSQATRFCLIFELPAIKQKVNPTRIPISTKESQRRLDNISRTHEVSKCDPQKSIHIGDREADIYEWFSLCSQLNTYFPIRVQVTGLAYENMHSGGFRGVKTVVAFPTNNAIEYDDPLNVTVVLAGDVLLAGRGLKVQFAHSGNASV